jgi:hypothetical protein
MNDAAEAVTCPARPSGSLLAGEKPEARKGVGTRCRGGIQPAQSWQT